jgi:DNA-binding SARP family transcriptional activator
MGGRVQFHVLGPLRVAGEDGRQLTLEARKLRILLLTLLSRANQWLGVDLLADALWLADGRPESAAANLKTYVWQLRRAMAPLADADRIESRVGEYRLRLDRAELDAWTFEDLAAQGQRALTGQDPATAVRLLSAALTLWRGTPYEDLSTEAARVEVARLSELRRAARGDIVEARLALGDYADAIGTLRTMTADDPLHEPTWCRLLLALHASGRRAEALSTYLVARARLVNELGVEPGQELQHAYRRVLDGAPRPARVRARAEMEVPRHALPRDVPVFVGRRTELAAVLETARAPHAAVTFVSIDGMAGVGKTALALHAAHLLAAHYPDGQLFVDLHACSTDRAPLSPALTLGALLRLVGVGGALPRRVADRAAMWRAAVAGRRLLIVLDDVPAAAQIRPLLPGDASCMVIMTSRRRLAGLDTVRTVSLDAMPPADALALFEHGVGDHRTRSDPLAAAEIVSLCAGLPQAIQIAAARLRHRPAWSAAHLADRLRDGRGRLAELQTEGRSVAASFATSYRELEPDQRRLFRLLGLALGREVDPQAAAALADVAPARAERLLEDLLDRHLVGQRVTGRYAVHDLVRLYARQLAYTEESEPERRAAVARLVGRQSGPGPAGTGWHSPDQHILGDFLAFPYGPGRSGSVQPLARQAGRRAD